MSDRRRFSEEFKAGALEFVVSSGRSLAAVSAELGIKDGTPGNWVRAWKAEHPEARADAPGPVEWAKHKALQAENAALKKENKSLGKAGAFFAAKHL
ncbi:transposase [Paeniglutamicibacter sp. NPDC012692]|uniref:transposase n=1 Tax=Paeniglutamicibacter sp. NPDC012692 TaxID=3364388 RepID=UPI0036AB9540